MEGNEILKQLDEIFIDELDTGSIKLNNATTASEVDGWDSLSHIQLVVAIEKRFKIRFTSKEIQRWNNIGELIDCINSKLPV